MTSQEKLRKLAITGMLAIASATLIFAGQAPTGNYTATMGGTATTSGSRGAGRGFRRSRGNSSATSGTSVSISISSYSSQTELDQLSGAQNDAAGFLNLLSSYQHGTVTIGSAAFPINAAYSTGAGTSGNIIYILSSRALTSTSTSRHGRQATGTSGGYIRLTLNASGRGDGVLYSSTQVAISTNGSFTAKSGASTATPLSNVTRN